MIPAHPSLNSSDVPDSLKLSRAIPTWTEQPSGEACSGRAWAPSGASIPKSYATAAVLPIQHRMDMVLCDGKHFRAGSGRAKRVALFFIDDATRMMLGVVVGTAESAGLFLHGLHHAIKTYGLMASIFLDNGPGFIAHDAINVLKNLDILCIHGTRAYSEGHGKSERFNQSVKQQCLRHFDGNPEVDSACSALTLRMSHYITHQYNQMPHESLAKETPWSRFHNDCKKLRFVENEQSLDNSFVLHEKRHVAGDNIVSIDAIPYEMPTSSYICISLLLVVTGTWSNLMEKTRSLDL